MQVLRYPNIFAKLCVCCEQFVNVPGLFQLFDCIFHKCPQKSVKMPSLPEFMALGDRHLVAAVIEFVLRMVSRRSAASAVLFSSAMKMKNAENSDYERIPS